MTLTFLFAFIVAIIKKNNVILVLKEPSMFAFYLLEIILIIFQIATFSGYYGFVAYASIIKTLFMVSLLIPFFKFKLYIQGAIGSFFVIIGTILNKIAISLNGGKMPVFPSLSYLTGYVNENSFNISEDTLHILGNDETKAKWLTDIFDVGYSVLSLGDLLIRVFVFIIVYYTIISVNKRFIIKKEIF